MGLSELVKVSLVVPGHRLPEAIKELYRFEWFHVEERGGGLDERVNGAFRRLKRLGLDLDQIISSLGISGEQGVIDQLLHGYRVRRERIEIGEVEELVERLEAEAGPLVKEAKELMEAERKLREELGRLQTLFSTVQLIRDFGIDLSALKRLRRLYAVFTVVAARDVDEIRKSLPAASILEAPVGKNLSALLIVSLREEGERVDRVLRGFGAKPFTIPPEFPQSIPEAYRVLKERVDEAEGELARAERGLEELKEKAGLRLVAFREAARVAEELLRRLGARGELKRFRVINGFIPAERRREFEERFGGKYGVFFEELGHGGHEAPALLNNKGIVRSFENVTAIQGYPRYDEVDPTPYVAIFFTIFYGVMFADLGQGLVLAAFGLFMLRRVGGNLREWAKLLAILGFSAAITGFILGEAFGFRVHFPFPKPEVLRLVEEHGESAQFNMHEVIKLMQFTLFLGALHLILGYLLSFRKALKHRDYIEAFIAKLPTVTMYVFGILFALCFFGAGGDLTNIMGVEGLVPYLGVPTKSLAPVAVGGVLASMFFLIFGRAAAGALGRGHGGGFVALIGEGLLEVLENIIHFMSNSLSYVRLTILLLVHAALLMLLNASWSALGLASLPILVIGNIGIMALEGMMVFIQALRLHLYEFFTKFYEGTGTPFRKIKSETSRVEIEFK